MEIIAEHPGYGRRRILPELEQMAEQTINHKRLRRLLDDHELSMKRCLPTYKPSELRGILDEHTGQLDLVKGREFGPLEVLSTDFTELKFGGGGRKAWLMAMVDIETRWVAGWAVGPSANRPLALRCWERARDSLSALSGDLSGTVVHQDQDSVYTSYDWARQLLIEDQVRISYSERGAKDNPWIESLWGRLKTELGSRITDAGTLNELEEVIDNHFAYYNHRRRHSALGYDPPIKHLKKQLTDADITRLS